MAEDAYSRLPETAMLLFLTVELLLLHLLCQCCRAPLAYGCSTIPEVGTSEPMKNLSDCFGVLIALV